MKTILLIIFAGCAVKCDESSYYVIQVPEADAAAHAHSQTQAPAAGEGRRPLQVYWNVPTMQCTSKRIPFRNLQRFGIIQNANDSFRGEKISILYDPGIFPALLYNSSTGELRYRNGGVPQEGDLALHLTMFRDVLEQSIPDKNFSGIGIIDFESWRPILRQNFGEVYPYKSISYDIERKKHWLWPPAWVKDEAKHRFEEAARLFMQNTIAVAKKMRPRARWGYYGFPYCFNMATNNMAENCASNVKAENDQIDWLWAESTALFPSVYSSAQLSGDQLRRMVRGRMREAARLRRGGPLLPYFWFRYRDGGFMDENDLHIALTTFNESEADGFIIWGSSKDVNTPEKCKKLLHYVENIMGPAIRKYTKYVNVSNDEHNELTTERLISSEGGIFSFKDNSTLTTKFESHDTEHTTESLSTTVTYLQNQTHITEDYFDTMNEKLNEKVHLEEDGEKYDTLLKFLLSRLMVNVNENDMLETESTTVSNTLKSTIPGFDYQKDTNSDDYETMQQLNNSNMITQATELKHNEKQDEHYQINFEEYEDTTQYNFNEYNIYKENERIKDITENYESRTTVTEVPEITRFADESPRKIKDKNTEDKSELTLTEFIRKYELKSNLNNKITKDFVKGTPKVKNKLYTEDAHKLKFSQLKENNIDSYKLENNSTELPALTKDNDIKDTPNILSNTTLEAEDNKTIFNDTIGKNVIKHNINADVFNDTVTTDLPTTSKNNNIPEIIKAIDTNTASHICMSENSSTLSKEKGKTNNNNNSYNIVDSPVAVQNLKRAVNKLSNIELKTGLVSLNNITNINKEQQGNIKILKPIVKPVCKFCDITTTTEVDNITTLTDKSEKNSTASKDLQNDNILDLPQSAQNLYSVVNNTANIALKTEIISASIDTNTNKEEHNNFKVLQKYYNMTTFKKNNINTTYVIESVTDSTLINNSEHNSTEANKDSRRRDANEKNNTYLDLSTLGQIENHNKTQSETVDNMTKKREIDNDENVKLKELTEKLEEKVRLQFSTAVKTANEIKQNNTIIEDSSEFQLTDEAPTNFTIDQVFVQVI